MGEIMGAVFLSLFLSVLERTELLSLFTIFLFCFFRCFIRLLNSPFFGGGGVGLIHLKV